MRYIIVVMWLLGASMAHSQWNLDSTFTDYNMLTLTQESILNSLDIKSNHRWHNFTISHWSFTKPASYLKPTAFFCVLESDLEKRSKIPLRMRLGTLDYANALEGKSPSILAE